MTRATTYICPRCGQTITLHVKPAQPPTCRNPKAHGSTAVTMTPKH